MADTSVSKNPFRQFYYRGVESSKLVDVPHDELLTMLHSRARRRFARGSVNEHLLNRLRKAKKEVVDPTVDKPKIIKTHLRNAIILPEMIGSQVAVYSGKGYYLVDVKPPMVGHYLGEFSLTYVPIRHGGKGNATNTQKYLPFK